MAMAYAVVEATCRLSPGVFVLFPCVIMCLLVFNVSFKSAIPNGISARLIGAPPLRRSVLRYTQDATPLVLPVRGCLEDVRVMMKGDYYIARGCRQRDLPRSPFCNNCKVAKHSRQTAIELFEKHLTTTPQHMDRI